MVEDFIEYMVKKKVTGADKAKRATCFVLIALFVATLPFLGIISLLAAIIMIVLTIFIFLPLTKVEYEYLYCDKTITIDRILDKKIRKPVGDFKIERAKIIAPVGSERLKAFEDRNKEYVTKEYWSLEESDMHKPYVILFEGDQKLILDLPEKFVKMMQMDAPRTVFTD